MAATKQLRDAWLIHIREIIEKNKIQENIRLTELRKEERERRILSTAEFWVNEIIPRLEELQNNSKVKMLWRMGIPPAVREEVWSKKMKNNLTISQEQFDEIRAIVEVARKQARKGNMSTYAGLEDSLRVFNKEIVVTFPNLKLFHEGAPLEQSLRDVIEIHLFYQKNHSIGYIPGTSFITAMFLLYMDEYDSLNCLQTLFHSHPFGSFLRGTHMQRRYEFFSDILNESLPLVGQHLKSLRISPDLYLKNWFRSFFTQILSVESATRVFDNFLLDGEIFLYRCALGLLNLLSSNIQNLDKIGCEELLMGPFEEFDETILFSSISSMKISKTKFSKFQQSVNSKA
eukprot:c18289_g1_i3.p1 GENE.c18289_g1_i3~~c18289_g1_i3.p1  ORF type:complete len:344 (+),score=101.79 c18289_g1_i3:74-1105(+)